MFCLRCGYTLDANQSICLHCGSFLLTSSSRDVRVEASPIRREGLSLQTKPPGQTRALSVSPLERVPSLPSPFAAGLAPVPARQNALTPVAQALEARTSLAPKKLEETVSMTTEDILRW